MPRHTLKRELSKFSKLSEPQILFGELGIILNGKRVIDVPGRGGYVYVRLRNNLSEFVQAYNEGVQNLLYGVPVLLRREGNRYVVTGRDSQRYSQWASQVSSGGGSTNPQIINITRHGNVHSFDPSSAQGGGDISWIYSRQFMPLLTSPFNDSSANLYIAPHSIRNINGEWIYAGNTGTSDILIHKPDISGSMVSLVGIDSISGNPLVIINSGTYIPQISGTPMALMYMPDVPNDDFIPLSVVVIETGTVSIGWDNIYDIRQYYGGGGGGSLQVNSTGTIRNLEFINAEVSFSGTTAFIQTQTSSDSSLFNVDGILYTGTGMSNLYMFTQDTELEKVYMYLGFAGYTGTTIIDINLLRSGTSSSIFLTGNRPTLNFNAANGWTYSVPTTTRFYEGDILSLDIDQFATGSYDLLVAKLASNVQSPDVGTFDTQVEVLNGASPSLTTTSASYEDFTDSIDITVVKKSPTSSILVTLAGFMNNTSAGTTAVLGVATTGGDYDVMNIRFAGTGNVAFSGFNLVSGLGSGSHTFRIRWKRISGSGTITFDSNSSVSFMVQEVYNA